MARNECPTCGSDTKQYRHENSPYDADIPFTGRVSTRVRFTSVVDGKWYCGECPDTWHDYERRSRKDRRGSKRPE